MARYILHHLLKALHEANVITEDLAFPKNPFDDEAIYGGFCHLSSYAGWVPPSPDRFFDGALELTRRLYRIIPATILCAVVFIFLEYTNRKMQFNCVMRYKANRLGYSLNQKGLFAGVVRDPRNLTVKLNRGNIVASETEEDIFRLLGVPFQELRERVRG
ncbi:DNA polymerase lambda [Mycena venus]|uniref:DNA polymerase lambda n=1 Tax=Mycena venus TaxID=2733690 RepID=A0A8H6Z5R7_9AGAR|nr:DNA polymerase lambda [Mycena venus]